MLPRTFSSGDIGFVVGNAVDLAVEITVKITTASAMGLHGVPLLSAAFRGSPWNVFGGRGVSVVGSGGSLVVRGTPWNAVEVLGHCRGAPPKRQILYISLIFFAN